MTDEKLKTSINVRKIAPDDMLILESLAQEHDRSLEGEVRAAISQWVAPYKLEQERATRRTELAKRLHFAHQSFLESHLDHGKKLSHLAEAIGEERAGPVEEWFDGTSTPSFSQLTTLAGYFGCDYTWLTFGDEQAVPSSTTA